MKNKKQFLNEFRRLAGLSPLNEMEIADDYSERESMAREYKENPEGYIKTINSLLNEYIRKKGIPQDLGFVPRGSNSFDGYIAMFGSNELMTDVAITDNFGFDVMYTTHEEKDFYDRSDGSTTEIPDRLETNIVADNVSFDRALLKIGEIIENKAQ
jgi:hypothetical protein